MIAAKSFSRTLEDCKVLEFQSNSKVDAQGVKTETLDGFQNTADSQSSKVPEALSKNRSSKICFQNKKKSPASF